MPRGDCLSSNLVLTLDIDWAPDFIIDAVAETLVTRNVRATWFVTHASPAVDRLRENTLFELGIHPNLLPNSTQGKTTDEVIQHCMELVPDATSMRTHALVQSSPILAKVFTTTPIIRDVSVFLPYAPGLQPVEYQRPNQTCWRLPYVWEDDHEMMRHRPSWSVSSVLGIGQGMKILDFHPVHIYLNSANLRPYHALKERVARLAEACPTDFDGLINDGPGTGTLFLEAVEHLAVAGVSHRIEDLAPVPVRP